MARLARLYSLLLLEADRDPDGILDHDAARRRRRQARREARRARRGAEGAAERHGQRDRSRGVHPDRPQAARARRRRRARLPATSRPRATSPALEDGLAALHADDLAAAASHLSLVGDNALARRLSRGGVHGSAATARTRTRRTSRGRGARTSPRARTSGASSRRCAASRSPGRSGRGSRARSTRHIEATRADLERRLATMERALHSERREARHAGAVTRRTLAAPPSSRPAARAGRRRDRRRAGSVAHTTERDLSAHPQRARPVADPRGVDRVAGAAQHDRPRAAHRVARLSPLLGRPSTTARRCSPGRRPRC